MSGILMLLFLGITVLAYGVEAVPSEGETVCCGFSGSFSANFPEISNVLMTRKIANAEKRLRLVGG